MKFIELYTNIYSKERWLTLSSGTDINLKQIAQDCGLFSNAEAVVVTENIDKLKEFYDNKSLINIYNYMLCHASEPDVIMHLIRCVDMFRDKSSLEYLVDILLLKNANSAEPEIKEKYVNVRVMCAKAIANQKDTGVVSSLLYCLNNKDENYRVRLACADALGRIGDRFAVAPLIEVVTDEDEKSVYLRESAASALGMLGDMRAIDPLVSILETKLTNLNIGLVAVIINSPLQHLFANVELRIFKLRHCLELSLSLRNITVVFDDTAVVFLLLF